jgi:hypothetical protein
MTDRDRIREFLDTIGARLDELYGDRGQGGPSIEDILNDPRDFPLADNSPGIQYALGWLRGAAEILDQTVLEFLWDHDLGDADINAWPRRATFHKPKRKARAQRPPRAWR